MTWLDGVPRWQPPALYVTVLYTVALLYSDRGDRGLWKSLICPDSFYNRVSVYHPLILII